MYSLMRDLTAVINNSNTAGNPLFCQLFMHHFNGDVLLFSRQK